MNFIQDVNSVLLTESLCNEFEQKIRARLTNDYKNFLLQTVNGGRIDGEGYLVTVPNWGKTVMNSFLGIGAHERFNLEKTIWLLGEDQLPAGMIPIAVDPGGNFFFLALSGDETGKVYFYFHEEEPNDPPTASNNPSLTVLTNSFTEFLDIIEHIESA